MNKKHLLTPEGLQKIQVELEFLSTTKRTEVAERLTVALNDGQDDEFVDNAELDSARADQAFLEGRILEIQEVLRYYELIEAVSSTDVVQIGSFVTIIEEDDDEAEDERYHLVGAAEADPRNGRISNESPLGKELLGQKVGDVVSIEAPVGIVSFTIVSIDIK